MNKHISIIWNNKDNIKYQDEIISIIKNKFQINYMFDMNINDNSVIQFCNLLYYFDDWTYRPNRAKNKFKVLCFNDTNPEIEYIKIKQGWRYINKNTYNLKKNLRKKYNVGTLIHISDNISETIHNCSIIYLFLENKIYKNNLIYTIRYENNKLNMKNITNSVLSKTNEKLFNNFKNHIIKSEYNIDDFCIDGSFILEIIGLRKAEDLNYICLDNNISFNIEETKNHKEILNKFTNYSKEDILYNPKHHFLFNGIKCIKLSIYREIKINRLKISQKDSINYKKDNNDIILINNFLK